MKVALITGITGQDGSYLTELLLEKQYLVWGIIRRSSNIPTSRIDHIYDHPNVTLKYGDLCDGTNLFSILSEIQSRYSDLQRLEIYNLGAMSHVGISFEIPEYTAEVDALGVLKILNAIRSSGLSKITRFYQASTSELYGKVAEIPQTEKTPFYPRSPYAVSKLFAFWITKNYRESYGMFACNGILFNHESPRRGHNFVTRKITRGLGQILRGEKDCIPLGNLDAQRDWGHARDYVYGMWLILQAEKPDDYVLSTGETHSIREFVEKAFACKGIPISWKGSGLDEVGYDKRDDHVYITVSSKYFRPAEVNLLLGSSEKAQRELGWRPQVGFDELIREMVKADCE